MIIVLRDLVRMMEQKAEDIRVQEKIIRQLPLTPAIAAAEAERNLMEMRRDLRVRNDFQREWAEAQKKLREAWVLAKHFGLSDATYSVLK